MTADYEDGLQKQVDTGNVKTKEYNTQVVIIQKPC